jgi:superfamily II DNA or RNA helicase
VDALRWPSRWVCPAGSFRFDLVAVQRWFVEAFSVELTLPTVEHVVYIAEMWGFHGEEYRRSFRLGRHSVVTPEILEQAIDDYPWYVDSREMWAIIVCIAVARTDLQERFELASWRLIHRQLNAQDEDRAQVRDTRPGWTVLMLPDTGRELPELRYRVQAKRTGKMLKTRAIKPLKSIDEILREPTAADRQAWDMQQGFVSAKRHQGEPAARRQAWLGRLLDLAPDLQEVEWQERTLSVDSTPWRPTLTASDRLKGRRKKHGKGSIWLSVEPMPLAVFREGRGWVVLEGDRLHPIHPSAEPVLDFMDDAKGGAAEIKTAHLPDFISSVLSRINLPLELSSLHLQMETLEPQPRLLITTEAFETIVTDLRFKYGAMDLTGAHGAVLATSKGLIQRDFELEQTFRDALERAIAEARLTPDVPETSWPARLYEDAAWRFLRDLPARFPDWQIEADKALLRRLRGKASPRVSVDSASDWFDLKLGMEVDGKDMGIRRVLQAWRAQRQFVALKNGDVVELPAVWLEQHGATLEAVEDLRKATGKQLGAPAALLAAELLAEADADSVQAAERWLAVAENLRGVDRVPEREVPQGLKATLRDYQHRGFRWLCFLRDIGLGGVLADDMGLGKTVQTLALLLDGRQAATAPDLVVAPTSVVHNWMLEAARFAPSLKVHLHHGPKRGALPTDVDLVITTYALLRIDKARLAGPWHVAVLDEAQNIKNHLSGVSKVARTLDADHRFALTGTPMENHLLELWSIMGFVAPGLFGTKEGFSRHFAGPIAGGGELATERLAELSGRMRPFVLRRLKREVATELPSIQEQVLHVELGPAQRRFYDHIRDAYRAEVDGIVEASGMATSKIKALEALLRLRQAACEPALIPLADAKAVGESAKRAMLREMLPVLAEEGHRSLIFSQWPGFLKLVAQDLEAAGLKYLYLDGSTTHRGGLQARWNDPKGPPFFLISIKAGGTGLNLIAADHVIHLDPWWNPAVEQQATDRAHRIGQKKPVLVYKLVAQGTVEEKIVELQARKRALFNATVDADRIGVDELSGGDLEFVFGKTVALTLPTKVEVPVVVDEPAVVDDFARVLAAEAPITNGLLRAVLDLDQGRARQQLAAWVTAGLLEKTGRGRGTRYLKR